VTDEQPTPDERHAWAINANLDLAVALRLLSAMEAGDLAGVAGITVEVVNSGRGTEVLHALTIQALEFGRGLLGDRLGAYLDAKAMEQIDVADFLACGGDPDASV
jgi:hypothetical protein